MLVHPAASIVVVSAAFVTYTIPNWPTSTVRFSQLPSAPTMPQYHYSRRRRSKSGTAIRVVPPSGFGAPGRKHHFPYQHDSFFTSGCRGDLAGDGRRGCQSRPKCNASSCREVIAFSRCENMLDRRSSARRIINCWYRGAAAVENKWLLNSWQKFSAERLASRSHHGEFRRTSDVFALIAPTFDAVHVSMFTRWLCSRLPPDLPYHGYCSCCRWRRWCCMKIVNIGVICPEKMSLPGNFLNKAMALASRKRSAPRRPSAVTRANAWCGSPRLEHESSGRRASSNSRSRPAFRC